MSQPRSGRAEANRPSGARVTRAVSGGMMAMVGVVAVLAFASHAGAQSDEHPSIAATPPTRAAAGTAAAPAAPVAASPVPNAPAADDPLAQANQAQAAYDRGIAIRGTDPAGSAEAFRQSARLWRQVAASGIENGPLEFNLGNALLQSGDLGHAIAAYLRAEQLMPGDADLERNLAQARGRVEQTFARSGGTLLVDSVARWWHLVPLGARLALAWSSWALFWALVVWRIAAPRAAAGSDGRRIAWRSAILLVLATWLVFGGSIIADEVLRWARPRAVLVESGVALRKGNGEGFEQAFAETLGPGVECVVLEERPGWLRIELPDGRTGWVKSTQVERT